MALHALCPLSSVIITIITIIIIIIIIIVKSWGKSLSSVVEFWTCRKHAT